MILKAMVKEVFLCILIGFVSVITIVLIGFIGLPNSIGGKLILWGFAGLLSYSTMIFIPFFDKKKSKYFDGYAFAMPYLTILVIVLFRSKEIDDFEYTTLFSFVIGLSVILQMLITYSKKKRVMKTLNDGDFEKRIATLFSAKNTFVLLDVVSELKISEYKARLILKNMINQNLISAFKDGNRKIYSFLKTKSEKSGFN
jgi:hypothetical protein